MIQCKFFDEILKKTKEQTVSSGDIFEQSSSYFPSDGTLDCILDKRS